MVNSKSKDDEIIELLKNGEESGVMMIYEFYRQEFIAWSYNNFNFNPEESADVFQDTVISFYFNVRNGRLHILTSTLKTYLFGIGKNLMLKKIRKDKRMVNVGDLSATNIPVEFQYPVEGTDKQKKIARLVGSLGEPCGSIIRYFYFDNYSMEAIAFKMGYKNENVVKSQKLRCIKELKSRLKSLIET